MTVCMSRSRNQSDNERQRVADAGGDGDIIRQNVVTPQHHEQPTTTNSATPDLGIVASTVPRRFRVAPGRQGVANSICGASRISMSSGPLWLTSTVSTVVGDAFRPRRARHETRALQALRMGACILRFHVCRFWLIGHWCRPIESAPGVQMMCGPASDFPTSPAVL